MDINGPIKNPVNPFAVLDYTHPEDFEPGRPGARVNSAPPATGVTTSVRDRGSEADLQTNKITASVMAAPPATGVTTTLRDGAPEASLRTNKITTDVTAAPPMTGVNTGMHDRASEAGLRTNKITATATEASPAAAANTSVHDRALETGLRTNKITADGPASIQGFVKDVKGEPIRGADVRIESRDGKQVFRTVKTDPKGRYISKGLQPGDYRVTLLVNGTVKASIMNTQTKANQPTELNFDFKPASQSASTAKGRKHMVWVPNRTGSHLGGTWVEVDEKPNEHSGSNLQTYSVRR